MSFFASLSAFCEATELKEIVRQFLNKGVYIEFDSMGVNSYIKQKEPGGFMLKEMIERIYYSDYGIQVIINNVSYPILIEKYDIKLDEESNIILTKK